MQKSTLGGRARAAKSSPRRLSSWATVCAGSRCRPGWLYYLGGGVLGALHVVVALITVTSIGAAGVVAATIAGQLAASVVIDRLGLEQTAVSLDRVIGIALLLLGTYLVVR